MLAKVIVGQLEETLKGPNVAVIYFFCYNQDPRFRTSSSMLRALIVQLLDVPEMFQYLPQAFQANRSEFISASLASLWDIFDRMILDEYYRRIYCVVDALDECEDPRGELCSRLLRTNMQHNSTDTETVPMFKILITSRPAEDHIERNLQGLPTRYLHAHSEDLDFYMKSQLASLSYILSAEQMNVAAKQLKQRKVGPFCGFRLC